MSGITEYLKEGVWRERLSEMPRARALAVKALRVVILAAGEFNRDRCTLRASALTFYTLLSIVPVLAMAFGVAKGFGLQKVLRARIISSFAGHEEVLGRAIGFADSLLETTRGSMVAGIGVVVLLWSVVKVFGHIELSFNEIWTVKEKRSLGRRFTSYISFLVIAPVLFILSGSATVFIAARITEVVESVSILGIFGPVVFFGLKLLPYCVMWALLAFVYILIPYTRVRFASGLFGAVAAGTMYQLVQWFYVTFQIGISRHNAIYGSFAALPLFLVWLQLSWLIILFGAELSFAHQVADDYELEPEFREIGPRDRRLLAVEIAHRVVKGFVRGEHPRSMREISAGLNIPPHLAAGLLEELTRAGVLYAAREEAEDPVRYSPAVDTDLITIAFVIESLDRGGRGELRVEKGRELEEIDEALEEFRTIAEASAANRLLKEI